MPSIDILGYLLAQATATYDAVRGRHACSQVDQVLGAALKGFQVALLVLRDQPVGEARDVLANLLCHRALHGLVASLLHVTRKCTCWLLGKQEQLWLM